MFIIFMTINVVFNHAIGLIITSEKNSQTFFMITAILSLLSKVLQILVIDVEFRGLYIFIH